MKTQLYRIEGSWLGRLAIVPRPRGVDWLEDEIQAWRRAGLEVVVSLLNAEEETDLNLTAEADLSRANGLLFVSLPLVDRSVPESLLAFTEQLAQLVELLAQGKNIGVHCRQGIGRAALVVIGLLIFSGLDVPVAIERVSSARGCAVPETPEQRQFLFAFAEAVQT